MGGGGDPFTARILRQEPCNKWISAKNCPAWHLSPLPPDSILITAYPSKGTSEDLTGLTNLQTPTTCLRSVSTTFSYGVKIKFSDHQNKGKVRRIHGTSLLLDFDLRRLTGR